MLWWIRGCTPPKECRRLPPTYFWATWHQTRAFLISVNYKIDVSGWFDNFEKGEVFGQIEWIGGWSRGCTPPKECCRLPPTYFWATWHQTKAFLISLNIEVIFLAGLTILKKERCLGRLSGWGADPTVALRLRNAVDYRLPTFGPHGTKLGHSWYQWILKVIFLAGLTILKK